MTKEFIEAVYRNDLAKVEELIATVDVNEPCAEDIKDGAIIASAGITALQVAAREGHLEIVQMLLTNRANIFQPNLENNVTPLHYAAYGGHAGVVELLLERRASINATNKDGDTPLHFAAEGKNPEVVELLLERGADYTIKGRKGRTPLTAAIIYGGVESAMALIRHGARDVFLPTPSGILSQETVARVVLYYQREDILQAIANDQLLASELFSQKDKFGKNVLHWACESYVNASSSKAKDKYIDIVKLIVKACPNAMYAANVVYSNTPLEGQRVDSPISRAVIAGLRENAAEAAERDVEEISSHTAKREENPPEITPLNAAIKEQDIEEVRRLIDAGADINEVNAKGNAPLHFAAAYGTEGIVNLLLERGADWTIKNKYGSTPLAVAVTSPDDRSLAIESILVYVEHTASISKEEIKGAMQTYNPIIGFSRLQDVVRQGNPANVLTLINYGCREEVKANGKIITPVAHLVVKSYRLDVLEAIVAHNQELAQELFTSRDYLNNSAYRNVLHPACEEVVKAYRRWKAVDEETRAFVAHMSDQQKEARQAQITRYKERYDRQSDIISLIVETCPSIREDVARYVYGEEREIVQQAIQEGSERRRAEALKRASEVVHSLEPEEKQDVSVVTEEAQNIKDPEAPLAPSQQHSSVPPATGPVEELHEGTHAEQQEEHQTESKVTQEFGLEEKGGYNPQPDTRPASPADDDKPVFAQESGVEPIPTVVSADTGRGNMADERDETKHEETVQANSKDIADSISMATDITSDLGPDQDNYRDDNKEARHVSEVGESGVVHENASFLVAAMQVMANGIEAIVTGLYELINVVLALLNIPSRGQEEHRENSAGNNERSWSERANQNPEPHNNLGR